MTSRLESEMRHDLTRDIVTDELASRFWPKVSRGGENDCWEWLRSCLPVTQGHYGYHGGYGRFGFVDPKTGKWRVENAHRIAFVIKGGCDIPAGMVVMHICDNPKCCNPKHLRLGTYSENSQDRENKHRSPRRKGRFSLSDKQIADSRSLYESGLTAREIAKYFQISVGTANKALKVSGVMKRNSGPRPRQVTNSM